MQQTTQQPLFSLGQVVATPGALAALEKAGQAPQDFISRHVATCPKKTKERTHSAWSAGSVSSAATAPSLVRNCTSSPRPTAV
jgi:hypothetical protein